MVEETNRLLAIFTISTSPSPPALLPSFPSLSDYYPPVSFIPQTEEWYENDFKTNVGWVKDPRVLVRFLKTVTRQVEHNQRKLSASDAILPEWYNRFKILERSSSYPTDAFSRILSPLIPTEQCDALSTIFDIGAVITANSALNGCLAREVLCGSLGWWIMGSRMSDFGSQGRVMQDGSGKEGWTRVYRAWEEARDAMYHLFKSWIRYVCTFFSFRTSPDHVHPLQRSRADGNTAVASAGARSELSNTAGEPTVGGSVRRRDCPGMRTIV